MKIQSALKGKIHGRILSSSLHAKKCSTLKTDVSTKMMYAAQIFQMGHNIFFPFLLRRNTQENTSRFCCLL